MNHHLDPYKTLSLRRDATVAEITAAYRKLSLLHHPSRRRDVSGMFVAVSASYQTLIEPRYRRRYDTTTKSKSRTDEETGQLYYPALSAMGTGESENLGASMSADGGVGSISLGLAPTTTATSWENGDSYPTHPDESFGGSAFSGLVGLGSGVAINNTTRKKTTVLENDEFNTKSNVHSDAKEEADGAKDDEDEGNDNACWTGVGCGGACAAADTLADLDLAGINSLEEVDSMDEKRFADGNLPAVSTSGSSDAAGSPPNLGNIIFGQGRPTMGNRSPRSIGSESDYDVGAEALDALLLSPSTDANDIILTSLRQHQQPRMKCSGGEGSGESCSGLGRHPLLSDGTQDGGKHYTSDQTDLLFGGPLAPLYRARNFAPFEDPQKLFDRVMGSAVFQSTGDAQDNTDAKEAKFPRQANGRGSFEPSNQSASMADESGFLTLAAPPTQATGALKTTILAMGAPSFESDSEASAVESSSMAGTHENSTKESPMKKKQGAEDGRKVVKRTERLINGRRMIRTETTITDPKTGKRRTTVEVTKEDIIDDKREEKDGMHANLPTNLVGTTSADRLGDSRGFCDQCGAASVAPDDAVGAVSDSKSNPLLCGHCGRVTPGVDNLASSSRFPGPPKEESPEEEPLLERMSRQVAEFFSCGVNCGASCFTD